MSGGRYWATLRVSSFVPSDIEATIEKWYFSSTHAENAQGDIAHQPFEYVTLCPVDSLDPETVQVDTSQLYPQKDCLLLFFALRPEEFEIYVLGAATYPMAMRYPGGVIPRLDLLRSRSFFPPYPDTTMEEEAAPSASMFAWPVDFGEPVEMGYYRNIDVPRHVLLDYVEWLLRCEKLHPRLPWKEWPRYEFEDPQHERPAVLFAQMVGAEIELGGFHIPGTTQDMRGVRERYDLARLKAQEKQYWARMAAFTTEADIIRLFKFNFLHLWLQQEGNLVDENPRDQQCFYERYPKAPECPTLFFRVPMEEVPLALSRQLPLYKGGVHHLSYMDISCWIWNKYIIQNQQRAFERRLPPVYAQLKMFIKNLRRIIVVYMTALVSRPRFGAASAADRNYNNNNSQTHVDLCGGVDVQDMESLWNMMPPCLAALRDNNRFPKNMERLRGTHILMAAGLSINTITEVWLRPLNEKYPHSPSALPLEARFDAVRALQKGLVSIHYCGNVISDTIFRKSDTLQCPFVHKLPASISYDTPEAKRAVVSGCKEMCGGGGRRRFNSPHELMHQNMQEKGYVEKEGAGGESAQKKQKFSYEPLPAPEVQTKCPGDEEEEYEDLSEESLLVANYW